MNYRRMSGGAPATGVMGGYGAYPQQGAYPGYPPQGGYPGYPQQGAYPGYGYPAYPGYPPQGAYPPPGAQPGAKGAAPGQPPAGQPGYPGYPGYPPMGMGMPFDPKQVCLWNLQRNPNCWIGAFQCRYNMDPALERSWWYPLLQTVDFGQFGMVYQWFMSVDKDFSGSLDLHELMTGNFPGGIKLDPHTAIRFMRIFDADLNGNINFYEFMALYKYLEFCYNLFMFCDANHSGTMEPGELVAAIQHLGFCIQPRTAIALHKIFSAGTAHVNLNCFVAICGFCAQARTTYQIVFSNPYYGGMKAFNQVEFGKFLDAVVALMEQ